CAVLHVAAPALAMERSKRGSRSMVRPLSRPHTSGFVRSNAHGQRLARAWSQSDLSQLSILERNTRQMLEKATNSMRLPFLEEDCLRTLSIPMKTRDLSDCKKKSRSTAMLDVAGFGLQLDDEEEKGEEPPVEEAIEQLKRLAAQATDPKMSLAISGIVGELQAGVCTVRFYADGSIGRFVTLHALRLLRPEDDHVLMQVGRWRPRNGFLPSCGFPGSKRPSAKDFNSYIDFLIRELSGVLGPQLVRKTGTAADIFKEESSQFAMDHNGVSISGRCRRYRDPVDRARLATLQPRDRKSLQPRSQATQEAGPIGATATSAGASLCHSRGAFVQLHGDSGATQPLGGRGLFMDPGCSGGSP
ncbi:Uncharacterized protein SCF082_LOCUS10803, partial [Durusdinium trenchii]